MFPHTWLVNWQLTLFIFFCLVLAVQLFYYLFFFLRLSLYRTKPPAVTQTHPVSVIVCARDEAANIVKNLPGCLVQQYPTTHEVLVVNDNSYDDTRYVLEELHRQFRHLRMVELTQEAKLIPGKKFPLSMGIKSAKHEIVLLTDADCVPATEHWISCMQSGYGPETEIVLGYGAYHKKKGLLNKLIRWETFHTAMQYLSYALAGVPYMGVGRNLSYKKTVFFRQKGFSSHNNIPGGDDDLFINKVANKKNTAICIDHNSFTYSEPATSWSKWKKQKQRHYTTGKFYKPLHKWLLGAYSLSQFLFYPAFLLSLIFYSWKLSLILFGARMLIQGIVLFKVSRKLNEKDLWPIFPLLDIWMFFYYLIFARSLVKKPGNTWN